VKCGANHVTALAEVLSAHLDGQKTTALFLATSLLQTMTTEEAHGLFATHKHFIASIQRLPLFPQVVNIDRIRTEYTATSEPTERSTREWATGLRTTDTGQLLRCDVENGGKDKRAYLLVPTAFLDQAKFEYEQYKHRLKQSYHFRNHNTPSDIGKPFDRPQEIYIPTAAVLKNLQFMQNMSSESIWQAAPPSVRQSRETVQDANSLSLPHRSNHASSATGSNSTIARKMRNRQDEREASTTAPRHDHRSPTTGTHKQHTSTDEATTVCTTQSPLTRNTQTQSTISILEETIQQQQQEIRNMLRRFDAMDTKMEHLTTAIKTGEIQQNNTILHIQQQLDTVCNSLTFLVQQSTGIQTQHVPQNGQTVFPTPQATIEPQRQPPGSLKQVNETTHDGGSTTARMLVDPTPTRTRSPMGKSPEKKKQRSTTQKNNQIENRMANYNLNPYNSSPTQEDDDETLQLTDQSGAQYNSPSPSDGGHPE
jgi:hypothetical protein